jgi:hypothetical protein
VITEVDKTAHAAYQGDAQHIGDAQFPDPADASQIIVFPRDAIAISAKLEPLIDLYPLVFVVLLHGVDPLPEGSE